jgi:hypothetical protein
MTSSGGWARDAEPAPLVARSPFGGVHAVQIVEHADCLERVEHPSAAAPANRSGC